jgi:hypothetical protein
MAGVPVWHVLTGDEVLGMGQKGVIDGGAVRVLTGGDGGTAFCRLGCRRVAGK